MTIGTTCERCGAIARVLARFAGRTGRCLKCDARVLVPTPTTGVDSGLGASPPIRAERVDVPPPIVS